MSIVKKILSKDMIKPVGRWKIENCDKKMNLKIDLSKAKMYFDTLGIINHYDGVLSEIPENKKWIWIFDGTEFGVKHVLQIEVAIELAKLISSKFSDKLEKIIIINSNFYIKSIYNIVYFFLNTKLKSIVEMNYEFKTVNDIIKISE